MIFPLLSSLSLIRDDHNIAAKGQTSSNGNCSIKRNIGIYSLKTLGDVILMEKDSITTARVDP